MWYESQAEQHTLQSIARSVCAAHFRPPVARTAEAEATFPRKLASTGSAFGSSFKSLMSSSGTSEGDHVVLQKPSRWKLGSRRHKEEAVGATADRGRSGQREHCFH